MGGSAPGEVKHLSNQRKINRIDPLSSGERTGNSLNLFSVSLLIGGRGNRDDTFEFLTSVFLKSVLKIYKKLQIRMLVEWPWNGQPKKVIALYTKTTELLCHYLSSPG